MLQKAIELKQVCRSFKNLKANDNLTETIYEGEYIGLLGPNGAGKTTLVEMIEGIQKPDSGEIIIFNKNWGKDEKELRKLIGFSLQETRFIDRLSVYETLKLFCSFYGLAISEAEPLLELTGLQTKKDTYTSKLSGGQKQKLALCIALIHSPKILLLDEPTTGLDPSARRDIWNLILEQKKAGTTLILTTHYLEEAEFLCDRILIMDKGKFLARGSMQELLENHGMHELIRFIPQSFLPEEKLYSLPGFESLQIDSRKNSYTLHVKEIMQTLPFLLKELELSGIKIKNLECRKMNLDDLFLAMTGRNLDE